MLKFQGKGRSKKNLGNLSLFAIKGHNLSIIIMLTLPNKGNEASGLRLISAFGGEIIIEEIIEEIAKI